MKRLFLLSIVTFVSYLPYASVTAATNNYSLGNDKEENNHPNKSPKAKLRIYYNQGVLSISTPYILNNSN